MEFNWSTVAWIAGLVFVYLFGLFEGRGQGYKKRKAEEEQEKKDKPAPTAESRMATRVETVTVDDPGLLRIKNENGAFALDLDGVRANPLSLSSDQRKRLIEMLNIMRPWLEGRSAPVSGTGTPPPPAESLADRLDAFASPSVPNPPVRPASQPVSSSTTPRPSTIAKEDRPSVPANSIVGQIDSVLQARLAGTALEDRGVFLTESPEGGVAVYVGLTRYDGIEAVPDEQIKAAIRAAITEWENKYTPGI